MNKIDMFAMKCDEVIPKGNKEEILDLYNTAIKEASNESNTFINKSRYYYCAYNCFSQAEFGEDDNQVKRLNLIRQANICFNNSVEQELISLLEYKQYNIFLKVSLGNELDKCGRVTSSIESYYDVYDDESFEININLIISMIKFMNMFKEDPNIHTYRKILLNLMDKIHRLNIEFPENSGMFYWYTNLNKVREHLETENIEKIELDDKDSFQYRKWVSTNKLALNYLNDVSTRVEFSRDNILIKSISGSIKEDRKELFLIFNQIKQEYASSRFQMYEGLKNNKYHYSDWGNRLVMDDQNIIYSYGIEQIKNSYRSVYSIFDRIAFFINKYDKLDISNKSLSMHRVFKKIKNTRENDMYKFSALNGLSWINKDLYNDYGKKDNKYSVDPNMDKVRKIRNYFEHRMVKVIFDKNVLYEEKEDEIILSIDDLSFYSLYLIRKCREAIILLSLYVNEKEMFNYEKNVPQIILSEYPESFKIKY